MAEGQGLDEYFVELKSVHHLEAVEVPNNNVSLKVLLEYVGQIQNV